MSKFKQLQSTLPSGPYFSGTAFSLADAAFAPVFRYFEVFEGIGDFGFFGATPAVSAWRSVRKDSSAAMAPTPSRTPTTAARAATMRNRFLGNLMPRYLISKFVVFPSRLHPTQKPHSHQVELASHYPVFPRLNRVS